MTSKFANALQQLMLQQARELWSKVTPEWVAQGNRVNLGAWVDKSVDYIVPYLLPYWRRGIRAASGEVARAGHPTNTRALRDEMMDELREQVRRMLRETAKTTQDAINAKLREARRKLKAKKPNALSGVLTEIQTQLRSKDRALKIADTETEYAKNGGGQLVYKESEAKGKTWVCDANPCKHCAALNGKTVPLNQPFWVNPAGGPYAIVLHPPRHPNCRCSQVASFTRSK